MATIKEILEIWRGVPTREIVRAMHLYTSGTIYSGCSKTDMADCLASGFCCLKRPREDIAALAAEMAKLAKEWNAVRAKRKADDEAWEKTRQERLKAEAEVQTKRFEHRLARARSNGRFETDDLRSLLRVAWQVLDNRGREQFLERTSINGD